MARRRRTRRIVKGRRWPRIVVIRTVFFVLLVGLAIQASVLLWQGLDTERSVPYLYIMAAGTAGFGWCWRQAVRHAGGITPAAYVGLAMIVAMSAIHANALLDSSEPNTLPRMLLLLPLGVLVHTGLTDRAPATVYAVIVLVVQALFGLATLHPRAIGNIIASVIALVITVARRYPLDAPPGEA